jgi:hypothetical protein
MASNKRLGDPLPQSHLRLSSPPSHSEFVAENPQFVAEDNTMDFVSDDGGSSYNLWHCKSARTRENSVRRKSGATSR